MTRRFGFVVMILVLLVIWIAPTSTAKADYVYGYQDCSGFFAAFIFDYNIVLYAEAAGDSGLAGYYLADEQYQVAAYAACVDYNAMKANHDQQ